MSSRVLSRVAMLALALPVFGACGLSSNGLASWRDGDAREAVADFVARVSTPGDPDFVPREERIAVFDNDGTLWSERPVYVQLMFAMDRVRAMEEAHPEWRRTQPFRAALEGDMETLAALGKPAVAQIIAATHAEMTSEEFRRTVRAWIESARHPQTGRAYTEMVFQPMIELLAFLRASGFRTYIVSGGGVEFMRVFAEEVYGVPREQVIGTTIATSFEMTGEGPVIRRLPEVDFVDDGAGKPAAIDRIIGRRPILAAGNSDGDLQMLQWTAAGEGASLCVLIHHTDGEREWAYDRESPIGRLDAALDAARREGWVVVDMAGDWERVFPPARGKRDAE